MGVPGVSVAVIIPFYQREVGILRKGLASVLSQTLPANVRLQVIVVDDGSPVPARDEVAGLNFAGAFSISVVEQKNAGVTRARNAALDAVPADTDFIAFLDSDDVWKPGHINMAIAAMEAGFDLYFCDNAREGHHVSHFSADHGLILPFIEKAGGAVFVPLAPADMGTLVLRDFPCQISTCMYRRSVAPALRFDTGLKNAGEDVLFFLHLVSKMQRIGFSTKVMVECGKGINLYFSNMGWGCEGYLKRLLDDTKAHRMLSDTGLLNAQDKVWNDAYVRGHKQQIVFFALRYALKHKKLPPELSALAKEDPSFYLWFALWLPYVAVGRVLGFYRPF